MDEHPDSLELGYFVCYWLAAVIMVILFVVHSYKVLSDLCTESRKSVDHRVVKPKLTRHYRLMTYLTLACVFFNLASSIVLGNQMTGDGSCIDILIIVYWTYLPAKASMFMIFMLRLKICFEKCAYGYSKKFIYFMVGLNAFLGVFLPILITYFIFTVGKVEKDTDEFPNPCWPIFEGIMMLSVGLVVLWDFIMNILSVVLFIFPLRKTLNEVKKYGDQKGNERLSKMSDKMIYIAVKYTILAAVASLSTFIAAFLVIGELLPYLQAFDVAMNSICIMFMTAYYPDDIFYSNFCKICLLCCPSKYRKYESRASKGAQRKLDDPLTKDTNEAFNGAADVLQSKKDSAYSVQSESVKNSSGQLQSVEKSMGDQINMTSTETHKDITPAPPDEQP